MICPFCAEEIKDQAILCRFCGRDIVKPSQSSVQSPEQFSATVPMENIATENSVGELNEFASRTEGSLESDTVHSFRQKLTKKRVALISVALVPVLLLGGYFGVNKFSQIQEQNRIAAEAKAKAAAEAAALKAELDAYSKALKDNSWLPSGYTKFPTNPYMAYKKNTDSCASYGVCFPFDLITNKYCSSVYISANLVKNGVVYGFTNDTASGISSGTRVKMKMQFTEEVYPSQVSWVDVTCR